MRYTRLMPRNRNGAVALQQTASREADTRFQGNTPLPKVAAWLTHDSIAMPSFDRDDKATAPALADALDVLLRFGALMLQAVSRFFSPR
jgi:hypothetical protein